MNILSCDTSTEVMHVCFARFEEGKKPFFEARVVTSANQHSEMLVPSMLEVCQRNSFKLKELDLLVCTSGPGSFTGLRIAMSTLKGISLATGIPMVTIPTLEAYQACNSSYPHTSLAVIDAKKKRFYAALFLAGERLTPDLDLDPLQIERLLAPYPDTLLLGGDAPLLASKLSKHYAVDESSQLNLSLVLCTLGKRKFEQWGADEPDTGPVYVRKSDAEIALQETISSLEETHD